MAKRENAAASGYGVMTLGALTVLLVATGRPEAKVVARLVDWGVPEGAAVALMYVAPVLAIVGALVLGRALGRGRSQLVRFSLYAVLGGLGGFVLGLCLTVFAGLPDLITRAVGPLREATFVETLLWSFAALCFFTACMVGAIALFGRAGALALQVDASSDPDCVNVRRSERGVFGWSAFGMATIGLGCAALAVARQAGADARLEPALVALAACAVSVWPNYVLWRGFDELQRRHVVEGYAASAIVATLGAFVWAVAEAVGWVAPLGASGTFLVLIGVQFVATSFVTASVMGQAHMLGKPA